MRSGSTTLSPRGDEPQQGAVNDVEYTVQMNADELLDVILTLEIRIQDERRLFFGAPDYTTRQRSREAGERMIRLASRLREQLGTSH